MQKEEREATFKLNQLKLLSCNIEFCNTTTSSSHHLTFAFNLFDEYGDIQLLNPELSFIINYCYWAVRMKGKRIIKGWIWLPLLKFPLWVDIQKLVTGITSFALFLAFFFFSLCWVLGFDYNFWFQCVWYNVWNFKSCFWLSSGLGWSYFESLDALKWDICWYWWRRLRVVQTVVPRAISSRRAWEGYVGIWRAMEEVG